MKIVIWFVFVLIFLIQNSQRISSYSSNNDKLVNKQQATLLLANQKRQFFKVLKFIAESSSLFCIQCFKGNLARMLTCLSQPPLPDRVDFIRQRCKIPANLYSKIINKYRP